MEIFAKVHPPSIPHLLPPPPQTQMFGPDKTLLAESLFVKISTYMYMYIMVLYCTWWVIFGDYNAHVCMQVPIFPIRKGMQSVILSAIYYSSENRNVRTVVRCAHVIVRTV